MHVNFRFCFSAIFIPGTVLTSIGSAEGKADLKRDGMKANFTGRCVSSEVPIRKIHSLKNRLVLLLLHPGSGGASFSSELVDQTCFLKIKFFNLLSMDRLLVLIFISCSESSFIFFKNS
jgi:hypothetical protein